ncbi:MAG: uncharacterized membrane protein YkvA (DUF1232 family) [Myxococcota bacterium]|jgi:uncharacterized membrane protein YkvA (DUF1232 family)
MPLLAKTLAALPGDVAPYFQRLADEEPTPIVELRRELRRYSGQLRDAAQADPQIDAELGLELADACRGLLDRLPAEPTPEVLRVIQAAIRYFLLDDDADPDMGSTLGLDDDVEVVNVVLGLLGMNDLKVAFD